MLMFVISWLELLLCSCYFCFNKAKGLHVAGNRKMADTIKAGNVTIELQYK